MSELINNGRRIWVDDDDVWIIKGNNGNSGDNRNRKPRKNWKRRLKICTAIAIAAILVFLCVATVKILLSASSGENSTVITTSSFIKRPLTKENGKAYVEKTDTTVDGVTFTLLCPVNAVPSLVMDSDNIDDSSIVLASHAADIRADNGKVVGAFVLNGELLSRGQSKRGFCAIVDGNMTIGLAETTPMLEEAIEKGGSFFRQYPLVAEGVAIDNDRQTASLRKALAEIDGKAYIIINDTKQTLNEFSSMLVRIGVKNAIYITGTNTDLTFRSADGRINRIGNMQIWENVRSANSIVWRDVNTVKSSNTNEQ